MIKVERLMLYLCHTFGLTKNGALVKKQKSLIILQYKGNFKFTVNAAIYLKSMKCDPLRE